MKILFCKEISTLVSFIHYTFFFNSKAWALVESSAAFSMRVFESLFKVSCNFSSMIFFNFNSLTSLVKASAFLVLVSEASFSFLSAHSLSTVTFAN